MLNVMQYMGAAGSPVVLSLGVMILNGRDLFSSMPVVLAGGFWIIVDLLVEGSFNKIKKRHTRTALPVALCVYSSTWVTQHFSGFLTLT